MAAPIVIDGSMLEGGGQILRYASALGALTGRAVSVERVRAKRSRPGLQPQHLTGLKLVEAVCGGQLQGGEVGSSSITLRPGRPRCGRFVADTRTAGSCSLMVQASLPVCLYAQAQEPQPGQAAAVGPLDATDLELKGGTDADMAPPAAYLTEVLLPLLQRLFPGLMDGVRVDIVKRGFYPRGGGSLAVHVPPLPPGTPLPPIALTSRGNVTQVTIKAFSAGRVPNTVPQRLAAAAEAAIRKRLKALGPSCRGAAVLVEASVEPPERAFGDGCGVLLFADTDTGCRLGASAKGERGVPAEEVGERAAAELAEALESGSCVDEWMQDQLIIWMALAGGTSRVRCAEPTLHTRTAMVVAEALLPGVCFALRRPGGHPEPLAGEDGEGGAGSGKRKGGGNLGDGLWQIECQGAGWTVGKRLDDA